MRLRGGRRHQKKGGCDYDICGNTMKYTKHGKREREGVSIVQSHACAKRMPEQLPHRRLDHCFRDFWSCFGENLPRTQDLGDFVKGCARFRFDASTAF